MKTAKEEAERYANEMYRDENEWGAWYDGYMGGYSEAMRWRDPKEELPEVGMKVNVAGRFRRILLLTWRLRILEMDNN